jgi:hypothetical protein
VCVCDEAQCNRFSIQCPLISERVVIWQSGMVQNRHQSGSTSGRRPPPPSAAPQRPKSAFFSRNSTHSANSIGGRRGVAKCRNRLTSALFWPSASCLAWRRDPRTINGSRSKYCCLILSHAGKVLAFESKSLSFSVLRSSSTLPIAPRVWQSVQSRAGQNPGAGKISWRLVRARLAS